MSSDNRHGHDHDDATPAIIIDSLSAFLHRDIEREGHRILLPFLDTDDLLRLSECSKGLINYRYHLSRIKNMHHPISTLSMDDALNPLLLDPQAVGGVGWGVFVLLWGI